MPIDNVLDKLASWNSNDKTMMKELGANSR